jgi:hypothetical protein
MRKCTTTSWLSFSKTPTRRSWRRSIPLRKAPFMRENAEEIVTPYRETPPVFYSGTPGDRRAHSNLVAKLRRAGLDIPRSFAS